MRRATGAGELDVGAALTDVELGPDAELTPDGEQLALGDPAVIQVASGDDPDDAAYRHLTLVTTVVEVVEATTGSARA